MKPILSAQNQMISIPLSFWMVVWLFMDKFQVPSIWYGVYWTIVVLWGSILLFAFIYNAVKGRKRFEVDNDGKITVK